MSLLQIFGLRRNKKNEIRFQDLSEPRSVTPPPDGGRLIVLTAPLTEIIDYAGYFIQMTVASLPVWLEGLLDSKYPGWRDLEYNPDGTARYMPAGVRTLEKALLREFPEEDVVACYPDDLDKFVGPNTKVVAVSTHNPLGVTFAAGVYTSIFGSSNQTINSHYAKELFGRIRTSPFRPGFRVIVGGSGGWQLLQTNTCQQYSVDCVVEGRAESSETLRLFHQAIRGETLPAQVEVGHPRSAAELAIPDKRTTFGVVELTTGCGRRCKFCLPDLNPQIAVPKEEIMKAVRANVAQGNGQISLATEDFFIWGQTGAGTPFYFPNREALLDLFSEIVNTPGVNEHVLSHCTLAPAVVDPVLIRRMSEILLDKSPLHFAALSSHPKHKTLAPLIGVETGSVRMAKMVMPSKAVPFSIDDWPSVVIQALTVFNENNWFPAMTLMIGNPGETDDDIKATIDMLAEIERRGLFAFFIPSIFTPLHDTRMESQTGVTKTTALKPLQWQLMMKCWKMNVAPASKTWWAPIAWRVGAVVLWATRLRRTNGRNFTWPLMMFAGVFPEKLLGKMGKIYIPRPIKVKSRKELLASIRPHHWKYLREDAGDLPDEYVPPSSEAQAGQELTVLNAWPSAAGR